MPPFTLRYLVKCSGWGRSLASVMDTLAPEHAHQLALPPEDIVDQIGALLALAAGHDRPELKTSQRAALGRLRRAMQDCLHDPTLTPARFAKQHGVSKQTLHALFAATGSSFGRELISMRLDYAKSLLADQQFRAKSIAEISALAGFAHPSHFARRFLEAFGLSPSAFRNPRQI
jgi:AraC-like DNA-binding protein